MSGKLNESGLFEMTNVVNNGIFIANSITSTKLTLKELHEILGHQSIPKILEMIKIGLIDENEVKREENDSKIECKTCLLAKSTRKKFAKTKSIPPAKEVGDVIHSDLCGPISPLTLGKNSYSAIYTDDKSDFSMLTLIKKKSENETVIKEVRKYIKTQTGQKMKKLISDGGGEYTGNNFKEYLRKKGITHEITPPYTPQRNW
jgi:hypothetical protein